MRRHKSNFARNILVCAAIFIIGGFLYEQSIKNDVIVNRLKEERKSTSNEKENYYEIEYSTDKDGLTIHINNPCLEVMESTGNSMKPFWENRTLGIVDWCFPVEQLEVGDVIMFEREYLPSYVSHRIVEINFEDEWVRTKGDGNKDIDDFKGFEYIVGKEIGVLNVVRDEK